MNTMTTNNKKLNILFLTPDDDIHLPYFFYNFFKKYDSSIIDVKGVVIQKTLGRNKKSDLIITILNLYGFLGFVQILVQFIFKKLLSIFCSKNINFISLDCIFKKNKTNILKFDNINSEESILFLKALEPDLIISVSSSQKLGTDILNLPKYGCINIHNSKLPKNRGMMPVFWSMYYYNEDPVSAITIHKMNEKFDDGEILLQEEFSIDINKSMEYYIRQTKIRGAEVLINLLKKYISGAIEVYPNKKDLATYNRFPDKKHIREFKKRGLKIR